MIDRRPYWRAYYHSNKPQRQEANRRYVQDNREAYLTRKRSYYRRNREAINYSKKLGVRIAEARRLIREMDEKSRTRMRNAFP